MANKSHSTLEDVLSDQSTPEAHKQNQDTDSNKSTSADGTAAGANESDTQLENRHSIPPKCLSFTVSGPFAHFRKVETSQTRLTYTLPPRTTVNGLIAGILGLDSDSYYESFNLTNSAIAISIESPVREMSLPINHQNTGTEATKNLGTSIYNLKMTIPKRNPGTQRVNHNVLRDAVYRIDVWVNDSELYAELKRRLERGEPIYSPSLGLSEFLATITYHGEFEPKKVESTEAVATDSAVPDQAGNVQTESGVQITSERSPGEMEYIKDPSPHRRTTAFLTWRFRESGSKLKVKSDYTSRVGDRNIIFC